MDLNIDCRFIVRYDYATCPDNIVHVQIFGKPANREYGLSFDAHVGDTECLPLLVADYESAPKVKSLATIAVNYAEATLWVFARNVYLHTPPSGLYPLRLGKKNYKLLRRFVRDELFGDKENA